jgi:murein DD-endopeptidase MepM/ murein hydrolase activator NlpD
MIGFSLMVNPLRFAVDRCFGGSRGIAFLRGLMCLLASGLSLAASSHNSGGVSIETAARMTTRREGDLIHVYVENSELSEVTATFRFSPVNLKGSVAFPHTATFEPGRTEAFTLSLIQPDVPWSYAFTNNYKLGSSDAAHNDSVVYQLPYAPGRGYRVSQGYNGRFSHYGANRYSIDWKMPEGTQVRAARGGRVVRFKDDSNAGGGTIKFDACNNFVIIRHEDGTLGHYCHLKKDGVKVAPGQVVRAGEVIALSGNTGFSTGAHLHFCVFKTADGCERVTIPVKFEDSDGCAVTLVEGRKYCAPEIRETKLASLRGAKGSVAH